jgi:hypothetical protein
VLQQAIRALLLPPLREPAAQPISGPAYELDDDQKAAASWNDGPLLVHAGPGTGKTRTLVERIRRLLVDAQADSVLALTFSNKAAEEMRERLSLADPPPRSRCGWAPSTPSALSSSRASPAASDAPSR